MTSCELVDGFSLEVAVLLSGLLSASEVTFRGLCMPVVGNSGVALLHK